MNENTKAMLEKRYQNERLEEIEYTIKTFPEQGKYLIDLLEEKKTIRAEGTTTRRGCIDALLSMKSVPTWAARWAVQSISLPMPAHR